MLGVRGAAVLGGIVLALAGLLLFQYSVRHGLITPAMRVALGTVSGIGCLLGSEWLRKREFRWTPDAVAGAGIVILYASFWAAHTLFALIGLVTAFFLMIVVTVVCSLLALRHASQVVAVLGLMGGFATPILLKSDVDRPIGLFGYVLLLDLGLLAIAHRRRWPALGILSLSGTVLLQTLWIVGRMGPDRLFLGLVILGVFGVLFVLAGRLSSTDRSQWLASQAGAILIPFAFTFYFAGRADLGPHLYGPALLMVLLSAAASWTGRDQKAPWLGTAAAIASVTVVAVWLTQRLLTPSLGWEAAIVSVGLALVFHVVVELDTRRPAADVPLSPALTSSVGFFLVLIFAAALSPAVPLWPWLMAWLGLAAILWRHSAVPDREILQVAGALGLGLGLAAHHLSHARIPPSPAFPNWTLLLMVWIGLGIAAQALVFARRDPRLREHADHAAAILPAVLLVSLARAPGLGGLSPSLALGSALVLALLVVLAATRLRSGPWYAGATAAAALVHFAWTARRFGLASVDFGDLLPGFDPAPVARGGGLEQTPVAAAAFALELVAVVLFTAWPFLVRGSLSGERTAWIAAALAGPAWFVPLKRVFVAALDDGFIGLLPAFLAAVALAAATASRRVWAAGDPMRKSAVVWFSAVALCLVSVAVPLQLRREWITIGWALEGLALIVLWKRLDHPGLKYFALALLGSATVRLIANPAVLGYYAYPETRIFNWLFYTYLVPAVALVASASLLRDLEVPRLRDWEQQFYAGSRAIGSVVAGLCGVLVIFAWINLAIADWFGTGPVLTLSFEHVPARDLTVSIAWALYALALLGVGMARGSVGLRWVSLSFFVVTIGKVFLYDLGELKDLYRVASLVGLAASLLLVSLLYQKFIFRKPGTAS